MMADKYVLCVTDTSQCEVCNRRRTFIKMLQQRAGLSTIKILEKAAQGVAQCEVLATRVVVDAVLLCNGGKSRRGGHTIANISRNCRRI